MCQCARGHCRWSSIRVADTIYRFCLDVRGVSFLWFARFDDSNTASSCGSQSSGGSEDEEQPMLIKSVSFASDLSSEGFAVSEREHQTERGIRQVFAFLFFLLVGLSAAVRASQPPWQETQGSVTSSHGRALPDSLRNRTHIGQKRFDDHVSKFLTVLNKSRSLGRAPHADHIAEMLNRSSLDPNNSIYELIAREAPNMQKRIDAYPLFAEKPSHEQGYSPPAETFSPEDGGDDRDATFRHTYYGENCGISLDQNLIAVSLAGLSANQARRTCDKENKTGHSIWDPSVCAVDVTNILTQLAWMASYLSLLPSWCAGRDFAHQQCASDWIWIEANPLNSLVDVLALSTDCGPVAPAEPLRRLQFSEKGLTNTRKTEIGICVVSVEELAALSNKLSFNAWATSRGCRGPHLKGFEQVACSSGILDLISFGGYIAKDIGLIVGTCPTKDVPGALCGADAADLAASIISFGTWATAFTEDCGWTGRDRS